MKMGRLYGFVDKGALCRECAAASGCSAQDCQRAGLSIAECKDAFDLRTATDCKAAGYALEDIVSAGFSGSDIPPRAFGLRKLERKDDSERRVGARVLCEGKLGKITKHHPNHDWWNLIKISYDDGTKNKAMAGGGYLYFTNQPGQIVPTEAVWVGFS